MTTRINLIVLTGIILLTLATGEGCKREDQSRLQASWSAKDPILTPYNIRNHERQLGNLILNSSFEMGKIYYEENSIESFDVNGWKITGDKVEWVNTASNKYSGDEVFDGTHAIKISRDEVDETEPEGHGVVSDYIKVIPGNYSLKLFLRLENICPNQSRIGTKMYDAVNIRLRYFDKNKIEIDGSEYNAFKNNKIDNTFKSFTLSNYLYIDKLGWGEIHGKTANFPYFDGDIPDKTRYVKLFIGLKGSGTMWVDAIDLRYTNQNFTMLERMKPYFDSSYSVYDLILPKPKQITKKSPIIYYDSTLHQLPIIVIPEAAGIKMLQYAKKLRNTVSIKIQEQVKDSDIGEINIVKSIDITKIPNNQWIISVGNTDIKTRNKKLLPDSLLKKHKQSYYIATINEIKNIVFINSDSNEGFNHAVKTFTQLLDKNSLQFYNATIFDYPDFLQRAYIIHEKDAELPNLSSKLELLNKFKLNYPYFELDNKMYNGQLPLKKDIGKYGIMIDLNKSGSSVFKNTYADNAIKHSESVLISARRDTLMDCYPFNIHQDSIFTSNRNMLEEHIGLFKSVRKLAKNSSMQKNIEFIAPWSSLDLIDKSLGQAGLYFYDLNRKIPENVSVCWTGGSYCSSGIDYAEFMRVKKIIGQRPILMDNGLYTDELRYRTEKIKNYFAGKIRTLSLFEPYSIEISDPLNRGFNNPKVILNLNSLTELNTIRILSAANYYWNTDSYNPDQTLWVVLINLYGRNNAINLINYNDSYYGLAEICQKIELDGLQHKNLRIASIFANNLKKYYTLLKNELADEELMNEITLLNDELIVRYKYNISEVDKN